MTSTSLDRITTAMVRCHCLTGLETCGDAGYNHYSEVRTMTRLEQVIEKVKAMPQPHQEAVCAFVESLEHTGPTIADIAAAQGNAPLRRLEDILGGWPEDELDDGFEEALEERRRTDLVREFQEP